MEWPRGEATACKAVYTGSNPVSTSIPLPAGVQRAIGAVGARFLDTEEVTGSNPVSPTNVLASHRLVTRILVTSRSRSAHYIGSKLGAQDHPGLDNQDGRIDRRRRTRATGHADDGRTAFSAK